MSDALGTSPGPAPSFYAPPPPPQSRANALAIVATFVGILLVIALAVMVVVLLSQPPAPVAPCEQGVPCAPQSSLRPVADATPRQSPSRTVSSAAPGAAASSLATVSPSPAPTPAQPPGSPVASPLVPAPTPVSDAPPVVHGELWHNTEMGYSFEYNGDDWVLGDVGDETTALNGIFFDAQIVVTAAPASVSAAQMIERQLASADRFVLGRAPDTDSYDALLGPSIGYVSGEGGVFSGILVSRDGTPIEPVGLTVLASTNGRMTIGVLVICGQPDLRLGSDTHQHIVRSSADLILKSFDWDTTS